MSFWSQGPIRQADSDDGGGASGGGGAVRRAASVTLRDGQPVESAASDASLLDPANKSLAEALNITYVLLQVAMVVLFVLYLASGFKTVSEGQQAVRLVFGKISDANLGPGFYANYPFPFGEMVTVPSGKSESVSVDKVFWSDANGASSGMIKPTNGSGFLLTGDGSIVHAKLNATYRRVGAAEYSRTVLSDKEATNLVELAIRRGAVHAVAEVTIDDLLRPGDGSVGTVALRTRELANDMLREMETGITIDAVQVIDPAAPATLKEDFAKSLKAEADSERAIVTARGEATRTLSAVAGEIALPRTHENGMVTNSPIIAAIENYERALPKGAKDADAALATIFSIFDGKPVELNGSTFSASIGGEVSKTLVDAEQYRTEITSKRRADLELFNAKVEQFKANPALMIQREWSSGLREFLARDSVQMFMLPPSTDTMVLRLNRDPQIMRAAEIARNQRQVADSEKERLREQNDARFKTDTSALTAPQ